MAGGGGGGGVSYGGWAIGGFMWIWGIMPTPSTRGRLLGLAGWLVGGFYPFVGGTVPILIA